MSMKTSPPLFGNWPLFGRRHSYGNQAAKTKKPLMSPHEILKHSVAGGVPSDKGGQSRVVQRQAVVEKGAWSDREYK